MREPTPAPHAFDLLGHYPNPSGQEEGRSCEVTIRSESRLGPYAMNATVHMVVCLIGSFSCVHMLWFRDFPLHRTHLANLKAIMV